METKGDLLLKRDVMGMVKVLLPFALLGLLAICTYSFVCAEPVQAFGVSLAVAVASVGVGALLGFIFGIPRLFRGGDKGPQPAEAAKPHPQAANSPARYAGNSNLEEISDWLAKLLVGAGLAELGSIAKNLYEVAKIIAGELGTSGGTAYAMALMLSFSIFGFFVSYLFARRVLPVVFFRADADGSGLSVEDKQEVDTATRMMIAGGDVDLVKRVFGDRVARVANLPREAVVAGDQATWAQARLVVGDYNAASKELATASALAPEDARLSELSVFSALYADPPEGFRQAIALGEATKKQSPLLHAYLASAWGQRHAWEQSNNVPPAELAAARFKVVDHVKRALEGDPSLKTLLAPLRDPAPGSIDRDFETLKDDDELRRLLS